jgi:glycosyltransferase involved in cell wall biosynthesis
MSGSLFGRVRRVSDALLVYSPPPSVPGNLQLRFLNSAVHALAYRHLQRALPVAPVEPPDILVAWPPSYELARRLHPRLLVYDCLDLFPAFQSGLRARLQRAMEERLARSADAIVVTSRDLERRWTRRHKRVVRIPNGMDAALFGTPAVPSRLPPDLEALPGPRLGYVGTVGRWVDLSLLEHIAKQRPRCSVVVIGPVEPGLPRPSGPANLHWLGERPYASLPGYLSGLDVLLIPFRLMDLTEAVNPIKLYEYCSTGKPIVATPIEEVVAEGAPCHLGTGPDAFLNAVDEALLEMDRPDPARVTARQALARASSWDTRVAALCSLFDDCRA